MLSMRSSPHLRLTPASERAWLEPGPLAAALAATALALVALPGCSDSTAPNGGAGGASAAAAAVGAPSATGFDGALLPASLRPRAFALTDQHGRRVSLRAFHGRVTILAFLYTASSTTAPLIAQQIRGALDELESELEPHKLEPHPPKPHPPRLLPAESRPPGARQPIPALAVSVDPAGDTPARVRAFLRENDLTGRLEYLTGTPARLRAVWRAYTVVSASAGAAAYERSAFVLLLDRAGAARVELPLEQLTPEALAHDVRKLQSE
jgi:protein SCO1